MKEKKYSYDIANAINGFLSNNRGKFSFDDQNGLFKFSVRLRGRIKEINYLVFFGEDEYWVRAISPLGADGNDEKMMATMAEFICRINYKTKNGNFELDMEDGEIDFKCFVDCADIIPTEEIIKNSLYCPAVMFDQYSYGITDIIFNNVTAKEAIDRCESYKKEKLRILLNKELEGNEHIEQLIASIITKKKSDGSNPEENDENDKKDDNGE